MSVIDRLLTFLNGFLQAAMGIMMIVLTAVTFLEVILRYVFNSPTSWSSELSRFLLIWITMTGASVVTRHCSHLTMGFSLHRFVEENISRYIKAFMNICITTAMIILCYFSYRVVTITGGAITPGLNIPMYIPWAALPVNAAIMSLFLVGDTFKLIILKEG